MESGIANLTINTNKCTACHACELACSFAKEGFYAPTLSRIRIMQIHKDGLNVPVVCVNCANAPCIPACPVGAVYRDRSVPVVRIKEEDCIACGDCIRACPFGAVDRPPEKDVAIMCDLCGGEPACVPSCIYGALSFQQAEDMGVAESKRWATARVIAERIRAERGGAQ